MELLQIATAKFIIKCDKVYCKLRHMLQSTPGAGAGGNNYYKLRQYWEAILLGMPDSKAKPR